jgi:hypothetical protein
MIHKSIKWDDGSDIVHLLGTTILWFIPSFIANVLAIYLLTPSPAIFPPKIHASLNPITAVMTVLSGVPSAVQPIAKSAAWKVQRLRLSQLEGAESAMMKIMPDFLHR